MYIDVEVTEANGYIRERLDRAVACGEWTTRFSLYRVRNGEPSTEKKHLSWQA